MQKEANRRKDQADQELKTIVIGLRFGGAAPDKAAPVFYSLSFLAKAIRKPIGWVKNVIHEALPPDQ